MVYVYSIFANYGSSAFEGCNYPLVTYLSGVDYSLVDSPQFEAPCVRPSYMLSLGEPPSQTLFVLVTQYSPHWGGRLRDMPKERLPTTLDHTKDMACDFQKWPRLTACIRQDLTT